MATLKEKQLRVSIVTNMVKIGCTWYSVELYEYNLSCVVQDRDKSVGRESPDLPREITVAEFNKICFQVSETIDVH